MSDQWRALLYPLGLIATLGFGARFFIQWLTSEKRKQSFVPPIFWVISLCSSSLLMIHSFIQIQFPICLFQAMNSMIAWRNMNLISSKPKSLTLTLIIFISLVAFVILSFLLQSYFLTHNFNWMHEPIVPWENAREENAIGFWWNFFGVIGLTAFASRFWLQWWFAEREKSSFISASFWRISLGGAVVSLIYFIHVRDIVNIIGYSFGIIPYLRNLMLLKKLSKENATN